MAEAILFRQSISKDVQNTAQFIDAINNDNRFARYLDTTNYYDLYNGTTYTSLYNSKITEIIPYLFAFTMASIISFPKVNKIGKAGFYQANTQQVYVGLSVTSMYVDDYAFYNCKSLRTCIINGECNHIGKRAFAECSYLADMNQQMYNNISYVGDHAFENCINNGIPPLFKASKLYIGNNAFYNNDFTTITFTNGNITIDEFAFAKCKSLKYFYTYSKEPIKLTNINTFLDCNESLTIYVPSELYSTYINDPVWNQISSRISAMG